MPCSAAVMFIAFYTRVALSSSGSIMNVLRFCNGFPSLRDHFHAWKGGKLIVSSSVDKSLHLHSNGGGNRRDNRIAYGVSLSCFDQENSLHWGPRRTITLHYFSNTVFSFSDSWRMGFEPLWLALFVSLLCWSTEIIMSFHSQGLASGVWLKTAFDEMAYGRAWETLLLSAGESSQNTGKKFLYQWNHATALHCTFFVA